MTERPALADEVAGVLARLDGLPVLEHVAVFEGVHDRLRAALDRTD